MITEQEISRYSRQIVLSEIGIKGQEKLKAAKVLVIGAGGLGCPALSYLAAAGVGTLGVIDFDKVEESNLHRQILFTTADIGKLKAEVSKLKLQELNPFIKVIAYTEKLNSKNATDIFKNYDIIVDGSDNFSTKYIANDASVKLNKPLVYGAIYKYEGQVSVFNYQGGATYRCVFPSPPTETLKVNCSEIGVLGVLPAIIGSIQANEVLKIILNIGNILSNKLFIFNSLTLKTNILSVKRNTNYRTANNIESTINNENIVKEISNIEIATLIKSGAIVIDIRDKWETPKITNYKIKQLSYNELLSNNDMIKMDKEYVFVCQAGIRSKNLVSFLQAKLNHKNLYSLKGGALKLAADE